MASIEYQKSTQLGTMIAPSHQALQLELRDISKCYGDLYANHNISIKIQQGSIHAILGENGAGKSTLVNIIYGLAKKTQGEMYWQGQRVNIDSPDQAKSLGIGMVFQHFAQFEPMSVVENIALGIHFRGKLSDLDQQILATAARYQLKIDPQAQIANLSIGERQRVEIVRCLLQQPKLLILDEPTSVLAQPEVTQLFKTLRQLKQNGITILFIGHRLEEIKSICDEATVLRNGQLVAHCHLADYSVNELVKLMVGKEVE